MTDKTRMSTYFSWSMVNPTLLRALLVTAYAGSQHPEEVSEVKKLTPEQLVQQADAALGAPPYKRTRGNRELARELRTRWVPTASAATLEKLAYAVGRDILATKGERVTFLQGRKLTDNYQEHLWRAFISAHKEKRAVPVRPKVESGPSDSRVDLIGAGIASRYASPYAHQVEAWAKLDQLSQAAGARSGLIVIPTGGGKTATMVDWLVAQLQQNPELRVLWLADQQELVDQAAREFAAQAETAEVGFNRLLRRVHSQAGTSSGLADPAVDVVCATRQSVMGREFAAPKSARKNHIAAFFSRPVVVVIDEAHHAVSPSYQELLKHLRTVDPDLMLIGLTATPWPAGAGRTKLLRETFASELVSVATADLVASGDLATPVLHSVTTLERIEVTGEDVKSLSSVNDLPPAIVRQLNRGGRNSLVVDQWIARRDSWGKTLVFACDIRHAEDLAAAFRGRGVETEVLHSRAELDRNKILADFRAAREPRVLVSVGMLLEGVDIPSARTAFLCRPTMSHIVMRQMIGRVLRGKRAGGDAEAHIVDFVDQWSEQVGILSPVDIPDVQGRTTTTGDADDSEYVLPPVLSEEGVVIGEDILRSIALSMADRVRSDGMTATLTGARLLGFYDLDTRRVPVFESVSEAWQELVTWALDPRDKRGTSAQAFFDDAPPPAPNAAEVRAVVEYCRSVGQAPAFIELSADVDVAAVARRLREAGALTVKARYEVLKAEYESSLARCIYPSLQSFVEAVTQVEYEQEGLVSGGPTPQVVERVPSDEYRRNSLEPALEVNLQRDLQALYRETVKLGCEVIANEPSYDGLLGREYLPRIDWTVGCPKTTWAYFSWKAGGRAKGVPVIRVNRLLSDPRISDELLRFLIWHELCHHLVFGSGHNAEFRRLESLWLGQAGWDHELDSIGERFESSEKVVRTG